jgi:hypothetical protein
MRRWDRSKGRFGVIISRREVRRRKRGARRLTLKLFGEVLEHDAFGNPGRWSEALMAAIYLAFTHRLRGLRSSRWVADRALKAASDAGVESYLNLLEMNGQRWVAESGKYHGEFAERLAERWGQGLDFCELVRQVSLEAGAEYHAKHRGDGLLRHEVLARLHARACLVAGEIVALLRLGYASGAHARWRALHEVAVVAWFLAAGDEELSQRYRQYEHVESLAAARDYQRNAEALGYELLSLEEIEELEVTVEELCRSYGPLFKKPYGWSAQHFGHALEFRKIEEAVNLAHLRSYYRMASYPIHAGPKGITFDIGLMGHAEVMLAGPSNAGLADPGHSMCISLTQVTIALLNQTPGVRSSVTLRVLLELTDLAGDALIAAHNKLEEDESEIDRDGEANARGPLRVPVDLPKRGWRARTNFESR